MMSFASAAKPFTVRVHTIGSRPAPDEPAASRIGLTTRPPNRQVVGELLPTEDPLSDSGLGETSITQGDRELPIFTTFRMFLSVPSMRAANCVPLFSE